MLVHAHPDDEASSTGATMVHYARQGVAVTLVTCTRGELGEIVAADLAGLQEDGPDGLARLRERELADALGVLGVHHHHWLGGAGRWRDSGMAGAPSNDAPEAFVNAESGEAVRALVGVLRAERPHVVITYDGNGGYGHPDHIQAHRVTMAALDPAADAAYEPELGRPWQVPKTYWSAIPRAVLQQIVDAGVAPSLDDLPAGTPDEEITAAVDGREHLDVKIAALRAHRSQVDLDNGLFAAVTDVPEFAVEHYVLGRGQRGAGSGPHGWEDDLFAGIEG
ncbi:MAG: N-acetyl-1-D-myo-inositol-2-amino-2-deoxy-alpha-D-glucopyranoside deacetylase [Pseudonocardiaceae bacterium]|nr:N-acetyl-1-D-myo-inositol-2-amino-2-deoxy-alpha-D-glucopyranoside deacetylase [Pseudonocardiaceae bacterium]